MDIDKLDSYISDTISDFLYYNRKEDEELPLGMIEDLVRNGDVTVDQIVKSFEKHLREGLPDDQMDSE